MRLLLATAYFDSHRGGIEIVAGRLARELRAHGADVAWLATDATRPPAEAGLSVPVSAWNGTERWLGVPLPLPGPSALAAIWRAVRHSDALMLHDALYPTNIAAMLAARWHGKPVVLVQHIAAVPYTNPLLRMLMQAANAVVARPMLAGADQVVFISETVQRHFASVRFKSPPRVVFNGVDTEVFRPPHTGFDRPAARVALDLPTRGDVVLFVGRFVEKKGLHIIERLARLQPARTFALAGWGPIDPRAWGLPNVRVLSGLAGASLAPLYQASDVLVLPSTGEGLPLVMQEALACGLPVLCGAETAGADAALAQLVEGVMIDGADPDATAAVWTDRIDHVLAEPSTESARDARHAFVAGRYSWADAARTYLAMLQDLTGLDAATVSHAAAETP